MNLNLLVGIENYHRQSLTKPFFIYPLPVSVLKKYLINKVDLFPLLPVKSMSISIEYSNSCAEVKLWGKFSLKTVCIILLQWTDVSSKHQTGSGSG